MFKTSVITLAESCQEPMGHQGMWEGGVGGGERMAMQEGAKIVPRNRDINCCWAVNENAAETLPG